MKLISLPDCKTVRPLLTLGKVYRVLAKSGNGVLIHADDYVERLWLLASRFEEAQ